MAKPSTSFACQSAQRGPLNTECRPMLLTHAFQVLDCIASEWPMAKSHLAWQLEKLR